MPTTDGPVDPVEASDDAPEAAGSGASGAVVRPAAGPRGGGRPRRGRRRVGPRAGAAVPAVTVGRAGRRLTRLHRVTPVATGRDASYDGSRPSSPWVGSNGSHRGGGPHGRELRRRHHRRRSRRLRRRALRRLRRPQHRHDREGTRSAAPASTSGASRPRSCSRRPRCYRHVAEAGASSASTPASPTLDWSRHPGPQAAGRRPARVSGLGGAAQGPQGHRLRRHRHASTPTTSSRSRAASPATSSSPATHVILASGSVPRTIPGFDVDGTRRHDLRRGAVARTSCPASAVVIGGGAIGCEFASMMADLGTEVTILEALPKILPGLRRRRHQGRRALVQEARHRRPHRRHGHRPRRPADGGTTVPFGEGESHRGRRRSSCRSAAGRSPTTSASTAPRSRSTSAASSSSTSGCRTAEPGVCAVGDLIATPALAHVGFAEAILVIQDILGEDPVPGRLRQGARGASTATPRSAFAGLSEEAAKEAGFDVVTSASTATPATAGRMIIGETEGMVKIIAEKRADGTGRAHPRRAHGRARGSPSSSARATWPSTGRPPSTRSPSSSSPTRR